MSTTKQIRQTQVVAPRFSQSTSQRRSNRREDKRYGAQFRSACPPLFSLSPTSGKTPD